MAAESRPGWTVCRRHLVPLLALALASSVPRLAVAQRFELGAKGRVSFSTAPGLEDASTHVVRVDGSYGVRNRTFLLLTGVRR